MGSTGELLQKLQEGRGDEALRGLYALDGSDASLEKGRERAVRVVRAFEAEFGARPQAALFSGPGRTEIGGNHTDHQHGRVLCGSVDLDMLACAAPNGTDLVRIQSEGYPALEVDLRDLRVREEEKNSSPALVRGWRPGWRSWAAVRRALTPMSPPRCCLAPACPPPPPMRSWWLPS